MSDDSPEGPEGGTAGPAETSGGSTPPGRRDEVKVEAEQEAAEFEAEEETEAEHKRLQLAIAVSIALVSILGAFLGWRAELHASQAGDLDQDAIAASLAATEESAKASTLASTAESKWERYTRLGEEASRLDPQACGNETTGAVPSAEAAVACSVQIVFSGYNDAAYTGHGVFDTSAYAGDVIATDRYGIDSDPVPYQVAAGQERTSEDHLLYLSILAVLALALFTLARLIRSRRRLLALCVPGWVLLAGTVAMFLVTEV